VITSFGIVVNLAGDVGEEWIRSSAERERATAAANQAAAARAAEEADNVRRVRMRIKADPFSTAEQLREANADPEVAAYIASPEEIDAQFRARVISALTDLSRGCSEELAISYRALLEQAESIDRAKVEQIRRGLKARGASGGV
jgi:hypothetical protein